MPSRRRVLGTVAAGLCATLAGCIDAAGVLQMDEATTDEILDSATVEVSRNDRWDDGGIDEAYELVTSVLETGSATASGEYPPLGVDDPVRFEGDIYGLDRTVLTTDTRNDYHLLLDLDDAPGSTERSIDDLPAVDVEWIESLLSDRRAGVDAVGGERTYTEDEQAASALVPEPAFDVLVVDGERMGVEVESIETTVTTYEYTLAERLGSAEQYAGTLETEYRFDLAGLSGAERDVVEEAIDEGGYYAGSTDDEAFEGVARTFFEHDPFASDDDQAYWITTYEGTTYVAMVDPIRWRELRRDVPTAD